MSSALRRVCDRIRGRTDAAHRGTVGVARGVRAAIIVPSVLALCVAVIHQPQVAGFAVFGTFAHLVMVNYDQTRAARAARAAALTLAGAILITVATLASQNRVAAVLGATAVGVVFASPLAQRRAATICVAALLSFMVAVVAPADPAALVPRLSGWCLAGIVAQPTLQALWIRMRPGSDTAGRAADSTGNPIPWWVTAVHTGLAMGLAVLVARALDLSHGFWVVLGVVAALNANTASAIRLFSSEQAGTILGFLAGMAMIAVVGDRQTVYWIVLPAVIFVAVYASTAVGVLAGQAGFTLFVVTMFCIIAPTQYDLGRLRFEDVALGGLLGLVLSSLQTLCWHLFDGRNARHRVTPDRAD